MIARPRLQRSMPTNEPYRSDDLGQTYYVLAGYANWGMGGSPVLVRSDRSFPCATPCRPPLPGLAHPRI